MKKRPGGQMSLGGRGMVRGIRTCMTAVQASVSRDAFGCQQCVDQQWPK